MKDLLHAIQQLKIEVNCRIEHGADGVGHLKFIESKLQEILDAGRAAEDEPEEKWIDFQCHKPFVELEFLSGVVIEAKISDFFSHLARGYPASQITRFRPIRK